MILRSYKVFPEWASVFEVDTKLRYSSTNKNSKYHVIEIFVRLKILVTVQVDVKMLSDLYVIA